jgi:uncharacterized GH25 family protein
MKRVSLFCLCLLLGGFSLAQAHSLWINSFVSDAHQPPHAMVCFGWGHALPVDDLMNSPQGRIAVESFTLTDPDNNVTDLGTPSFDPQKASITEKNFDVYPADLAMQKVSLKKDSKHGVYQLRAASRPSFFTQYVDTKGRVRLKLKGKDEIKDIKKVLMCVKYQAFASSYITLGEWNQPQASNKGLEIIPLTDLSNLRAGDLVKVKVLFHGKPVTSTAKSIEYITANSPGFGQSDKYALMSYVMNGHAQFRVQNAGQWVVRLNHKEDVTPDGPLKDLYGKAEQVYHGVSLSFTVK